LFVGSGSEHGGCDALVPVPERSFVGERGSEFWDGERLVGGREIVCDCLKEGLKFGLSGSDGLDRVVISWRSW